MANLTQEKEILFEEFGPSVDMPRRWIKQEEEAIAEVRRRVKDLLEDGRPHFPEVVGDRRILRFLRGKQLDIDESANMYADFLRWRTKNNVDRIRQEICYGGRNSPFFFPKGKEIIDLAPQIIMTPFSVDRKGRPLALEQYCFNPRDVLKVVTREDYLLFLTYALEFRALVMEQISHEREMQYLAEHPNEEDRVDGYGVILLDYTIRDLKGVGFSHIGSDGRAILKAALDLGLPNYPEYLGKSHMINVPGLFSALWYFVKQIIDEPTQAKFEFSGADYMPSLLKDMEKQYIPVALGGDFEYYNEPYFFDTSPTGPFYYQAADQDRDRFLQSTAPYAFDFAAHGLSPPPTDREELREYELFRHPMSKQKIRRKQTVKTITADNRATASGQGNGVQTATVTGSVNMSEQSQPPSALSLPSIITSSGDSEPQSPFNNNGVLHNLDSPSTTQHLLWQVRYVGAGIVDFVRDFISFCWYDRPYMASLGLVAALVIALREPIALQAVLVGMLVFYVFRAD